jgi:hypothetical protein
MFSAYLVNQIKGTKISLCIFGSVCLDNVYCIFSLFIKCGRKEPNHTVCNCLLFLYFTRKKEFTFL